MTIRLRLSIPSKASGCTRLRASRPPLATDMMPISYLPSLPIGTSTKMVSPTATPPAGEPRPPAGPPLAWSSSWPDSRRAVSASSHLSAARIAALKHAPSSGAESTSTVSRRRIAASSWPARPHALMAALTQLPVGPTPHAAMRSISSTALRQSGGSLAHNPTAVWKQARLGVMLRSCIESRTDSARSRWPAAASSRSEARRLVSRWLRGAKRRHGALGCSPATKACSRIATACSPSRPQALIAFDRSFCRGASLSAEPPWVAVLDRLALPFAAASAPRLEFDRREGMPAPMAR
eukprot:scaffold27997_cov65-Phaeocystis_antarctica.AAC.7